MRWLASAAKAARSSSPRGRPRAPSVPPCAKVRRTCLRRRTTPRPPARGGSEAHGRDASGPRAKGVEFERHGTWRLAASLEAYADDCMEHFPPMAAARGILGDRLGDLREQNIAIWRDANTANDGSLRLPQEYLLAIVRL